MKDSIMVGEAFITDQFRSRWVKYREVLRREDQLMLDEMFRAPDVHHEAVSAMSGVSGFEPMFMAMLIEQTRIDDQIDAKLTEIEQRLMAIERR